MAGGQFSGNTAGGNGGGLYVDADLDTVSLVSVSVTENGAGGKGGGKAHMAQAGLPDADRFDEAARRGLELVGDALSNGP